MYKRVLISVRHFSWLDEVLLCVFPDANVKVSFPKTVILLLNDIQYDTSSTAEVELVLTLIITAVIYVRDII